jgi:HAD superfamily hydrolase (TIGR01509 family)
LGTTKEQLKSALAKYKKDFYTGKITENDYWNSILHELAIETGENLAEVYRTYVTLNREALPILDQLKDSYTLVACNNCPKEWMDYRVKIANLDQYFSKFITSGYVGYIKPDPQIYEILLQSYPDQEITYIDDDFAYVEAAKSLGMDSLHFHDFSDLKKFIN